MRYYLHIAYDGRAYHGWQRQSHVISIQEVLENRISEILGEKTICIGCGRTDAGVHASQYILHFDTKKDFPSDFIQHLKSRLPEDIHPFEYSAIEKGPHAQFNATRRSYEYYFHIGTTPSDEPYSGFFFSDALDLESMEEAVESIRHNLDFRHFCKRPDSYQHTRCIIYEIGLKILDKDRFRFDITADRFLRGMIRILIHRLIEVGRGRLDIEKFKSYLNPEVKPEFIKYAPAQGLFLSEITYPKLRFAKKKWNRFT